MNGVLRPYTLAIQHNVVMQYPDYFASVDARELEAQIMAVMVSVHAYGFCRLDYLQVLVEQVFFGDDFIEQDRTGTLLAALSTLFTNDDEEKKFHKFMGYWLHHEKRLLNNK